MQHDNNRSPRDRGTGREASDLSRDESKHQSHPGIIKRLRRAEGHLRSVIAMIEEGRPCIDVAPQLQAVEKAISNAKTEFIRDHIDHCLGDSTSNSAHGVVKELKAITKFL